MHLQQNQKSKREPRRESYSVPFPTPNIGDATHIILGCSGTQTEPQLNKVNNEERETELGDGEMVWLDKLKKLCR